jgi:small-conductance mechanosensitive channel
MSPMSAGDLRGRRVLANNLVIVPTAKLAQAVVVNHHLPPQDLAVLVEVGVDHASGLEHVERIVIRAKEFTDQCLLKHEFVKRLHVRFDREGIVIPFPIRTLAYREWPSDGPVRSGTATT